MKTDPYIYQNLTHIFTGDQKFAPILIFFFFKIYVKFAQIWEIFSNISRKLAIEKDDDPYIYQNLGLLKIGLEFSYI